MLTGIDYALERVPIVKPVPVCEKGEFKIAAAGLEHGHIFGMCALLEQAGAVVKSVYDPDPEKVKLFLKQFPHAKPAENIEEILGDREIKLVASAAVTSKRADFGIKVMHSGKDYFVDKAPATTLEQLERVRRNISETGRIFAVYYSERIGSEAAEYADSLIKGGLIGDVIQVMGMGPHRLSPETRPDWFFKKEFYGGILCDIGSHQIEQFLHYSGASDAKILSSKIANYNHPEYPELDDFGDCTLLGNNGVSGYFRVDWFTPKGLSVWGDGRTFILGTKGYIELRKYAEIARGMGTDNLYLVNEDGEFYMNLHGKVGYPYFGRLISDCLNRTQTAMDTEHTLKAAELCIKAQNMAAKI